MGKEEYRSCMAKNMGGGRLKGLSKEERRIEFCVIAKQCSGKTKSENEAKRICSEPKAPKPEKSRATQPAGKSEEKRLLELAHCMAENIDMNLASNINSIETALLNAMLECQYPHQK